MAILDLGWVVVNQNGWWVGLWKERPSGIGSWRRRGNSGRIATIGPRDGRNG